MLLMQSSFHSNRPVKKFLPFTKEPPQVDALRIQMYSFMISDDHSSEGVAGLQLYDYLGDDGDPSAVFSTLL